MLQFQNSNFYQVILVETCYLMRPFLKKNEIFIRNLCPTDIEPTSCLWDPYLGTWTRTWEPILVCVLKRWLNIGDSYGTIDAFPPLYFINQMTVCLQNKVVRFSPLTSKLVELYQELTDQQILKLNCGYSMSVFLAPPLQLRISRLEHFSIICNTYQQMLKFLSTISKLLKRFANLQQNVI